MSEPASFAAGYVSVFCQCGADVWIPVAEEQQGYALVEFVRNNLSLPLADRAELVATIQTDVLQVEGMATEKRVLAVVAGSEYRAAVFVPTNEDGTTRWWRQPRQSEFGGGD